MGINIVSLIIGIIFGSCLVLAGLADPDRIISALRLKDTHIIRTIIVFLLVSLIGTWILEMLGNIEINNNTSAIAALLIGGLLVGAGMGLTGYSPGTSLAGAASGRIDAIITILGMFFGAYIFIFIYPPFIQPVEKILNYGKVSLPQITNISSSILVIPVSVAGFLALILLSYSERNRETSLPEKNQNNTTNDNHLDENSPEPVLTENVLIPEEDFLNTTRLLSSWKNFLFFVIIICLLFAQVTFWIVNRSHIDTGSYNGDYNTGTLTGSTFNHISILLNISNTILVFAAILHVLTLFFCLSASLGASLGDMKSISIAFFSALVTLVLLFPWQILFRSACLGTIFTPDELIKSSSGNVGQLSFAVLIYLRFIGLWAVTILLFIRSQIYSNRWKKSISEKIEDVK